MSSTTPFKNSPLRALTSWTRTHLLPKSSSCPNLTAPSPTRSSSPSSTASSSTAFSSPSPPIRGESILFEGPEPPSGIDILPPTQSTYLKRLPKRGIHVRRAKFIHNPSFLSLLSQYHGTTIEELIIVCRTPESLNKFIGALPSFPNLRELEVQLEAGLRDETIPGLARIPSLPNIITLRLYGWNRELWNCLGRACTRLSTLSMVDLMGVYDGKRQSDTIQRLVDNNQSSLTRLRISLGYETGITLQSLRNLTKIVVSVPRIDRREDDEEGEAAHDMLPTSERMVPKILDQQFKDGKNIEIDRSTSKQWKIDTDFVPV